MGPLFLALTCLADRESGAWTAAGVAHWDGGRCRDALTRYCAGTAPRPGVGFPSRANDPALRRRYSIQLARDAVVSLLSVRIYGVVRVIAPGRTTLVTGNDHTVLSGAAGGLPVIGRDLEEPPIRQHREQATNCLTDARSRTSGPSHTRTGAAETPEAAGLEQAMLEGESAMPAEGRGGCPECCWSARGPDDESCTT